MDNAETDILTANQAARLLQTSRATIYELIAKGRLKAARIGSRNWRIARTQVLRFCEGKSKTKRH